MNRYILAVSGGIDSIALLDMFEWPANTIVAHFNHGIRESSDDDQLFVEKMAKKYNFEFRTAKLPLGSKCSEETARRARYDFLEQLATEYGAEIVTAHHADDCLESIAINIMRGTGWRGLAPFGNSKIFRPLQAMTKADIYRYAAHQKLPFRLDQTNNDDAYLRNRTRRQLRNELPDSTRRKILQLYQRQVELRSEIDQIVLSFVGTGKSIKRELLDETASPVNIEILRGFLRQNGCSLTRPQASRCLNEVKKFAPGKKYSLDKRSFLVATKNCYRFESTPVEIAKKDKIC